MISLLLGVQQKILGRKGLFQHVLRPWTSGPVAWMPEGAAGLLFPMGPKSVASATPIPPQAELGAPLAPVHRASSLLHTSHRFVFIVGSGLPGAGGDWV